MDGNDENAFSMSFRRLSIDLSMSVQVDVQEGVIEEVFFFGEDFAMLQK